MIEASIKSLEKETIQNNEYETNFRQFKDEICSLQDNLNQEISQKEVNIRKLIRLFDQLYLLLDRTLSLEWY